LNPPERKGVNKKCQERDAINANVRLKGIPHFGMARHYANSVSIMNKEKIG